MMLGLLITLILASFRVTRFITRDTLVDGWRDKVPDDTWFGELVRCDWCAGVWVSAAIVGVTNVFVDVPLPFLVWGAVAGGLGLLASWER